MICEAEVLKNFSRLTGQIEDACKGCGRDPREITIIGASKVMPIERIRFVAQNTDICVFGENRVQEFTEKYTPELNWHFIGQLQTNKVKYIVGKTSLIHSVDRESLAVEISRRAQNVGITQDFLIEVNMGGELSKGGVAPSDVIDFAKRVSTLPNIRLRGLMSVMPNVSEAILENFYLQLHALYDTLKSTKINNAEIAYLSAGMSNDFALAIKHGANMVRLGRALFGER